MGLPAPAPQSTPTHRCLSSFFFQAEDGIRDYKVTGVQTCALPIYSRARPLVLLRIDGQGQHGWPARRSHRLLDGWEADRGLSQPPAAGYGYSQDKLRIAVPAYPQQRDPREQEVVRRRGRGQRLYRTGRRGQVNEQPDGRPPSCRRPFLSPVSVGAGRPRGYVLRMGKPITTEMPMVPRLAVILFLALGSPVCAEGGNPEPTPVVTVPSEAVGKPDLRDELLKRRDLDQEIRNEMIRAGLQHPDEAIGARMGAIDRDNTARLKEIIKQYGWPAPELVGSDGAFAMWLLVQHSEPEFQEQVLPLVRGAYLARKLPGQCYALLLDRVLVRQGKPQVYGSQGRPISEWKDHVPALDRARARS